MDALTTETVYLLAAASGYLFGAVPFGLVLTRMAGLGDIRDIGSGNIGATNVLRTGNKPLAALTLLLDSGKGGIAAAVFMLLAPPEIAMAAGMIAGFAAVIGHNFPVWLKFKGGKGVATTLGVLLVTAWPVGLATCATWLIAAKLFRISSLAALIALTLSPVYSYFFATTGHLFMAMGLATLAIIRHHENIGRIVAGTESKIGQKKKDQEKVESNTNNTTDA